MPVVLFEDHHWRNFAPLTLTKATFDVKVGARSFFEECSYSNNAPDALLTREHLEKVTAERHPCRVNPGSFDKDALFVNGLLHPATLDFVRLMQVSHTFAITSGGRLLAGRLSKKSAEHVQKCALEGKPISVKSLGVDKTTNVEGSDGLLADPWDLLKVLENALAVQTTAEQGSEIRGARITGANPVVAEGAEVEEGTVFDTRNGGIYIGSGASIAPCRITGPAYIGPQTQVKQFAKIENSFVGRDCRVGGEIEHSIISDYTNKAHDGFVGHSYVGEWVNLGAMTTTSDLKMTYGNIRMSSDTGMNKVGSFFADMAKTSIGTLVYSGRRIGVSSHLHGLVAYDIPSFTIYGSSIGAKDIELELASAVETQKRMMSRRGKSMSKAYEQMVKDVFLLTAQERKKVGVRKGKFAI